jgi:hypothetical protein
LVKEFASEQKFDGPFMPIMFKDCTKNMTMICWHHKKCQSFLKFCIAQVICDLMREHAKKGRSFSK